MQGERIPMFRRQAFTVLELVVVVAILAILALLAFPNYKEFLAKSSQARCMGNLRTLHVGLGSYLNDSKDVWPQGPSPDEGVPWAKFWLNVLEAQGVPPTTWQCPAINRMLGSPPRDQPTADSVHYMPTMFDDKPGTARRWATQPWLIERADVHGNGALICFTDGSIKPFNRVLAEQGLR